MTKSNDEIEAAVKKVNDLLLYCDEELKGNRGFSIKLGFSYGDLEIILNALRNRPEVPPQKVGEKNKWGWEPLEALEALEKSNGNLAEAILKLQNK